MNPNFYDTEYAMLMERRYVSGAFDSLSRHLSSAVEYKDKKVLDVGCGMGYLTNELRKKGALVKGIDYSQPQIDYAQKNIPT